MDPADLHEVLEVDGIMEERGDQVGTPRGQVERTDLGEPTTSTEVENPTDLAEVDCSDRLAPHRPDRVVPGTGARTHGDLCGHGQGVAGTVVMGGDVPSGERALAAEHAQRLIHEDAAILGCRQAVWLGERRETAGPDHETLEESAVDDGAAPGDPFDSGAQVELDVAALEDPPRAGAECPRHARQEPGRRLHQVDRE